MHRPVPIPGHIQSTTAYFWNVCAVSVSTLCLAENKSRVKGTSWNPDGDDAGKQAEKLRGEGEESRALHAHRTDEPRKGHGAYDAADRRQRHEDAHYRLTQSGRVGET